jgi:hypothetical protein
MNMTCLSKDAVSTAGVAEIKAPGAQSRAAKSVGMGTSDVATEPLVPSLVAQPLWATADTYVLESAVDDAFIILFRHFGDVIPTYLYPSDAINSLRQRITEYHAAEDL